MGKPLPSVNLVDAMTMKDVDLSQDKGSVLFLSIVPSLDTAVCEEQTHILGEEGSEASPGSQAHHHKPGYPFCSEALCQRSQVDPPSIFIRLQGGRIRKSHRAFDGK